ncbi:hypothetical protein ALI144C_34775 [Actinosynnema sp. ALI-1.44]|nr:hypothetical protein ALI144C_34775 [Actinosynnema sp. ALI-1.44]
MLVGSVALVGLLFPATAQAQQACTWQRSELPVPAGHSGPDVKGIGGEYSVALTGSNPVPGIVRWRNAQPTVLSLPTTEPGLYGTPIDVSANGTVVAVLRSLNGPVLNKPYVTKVDGTHKFLADPAPGKPGNPVAINSQGVVVGHADVDGALRLVLWNGPDYSSATVLGTGVAMGIDDDGFILARPGIRYKPGVIAQPLKKPVGATSIDVLGYDNGTAVGSAVTGMVYQGVVWNADGTVRYVLPGGTVRSANSQGTAIGDGVSGAKLWRAGQPADLPVPGPWMAGNFVTGRDTLIGTYLDIEGGNVHAAEWTCS